MKVKKKISNFSGATIWIVILIAFPWRCHVSSLPTPWRCKVTLNPCVCYHPSDNGWRSAAETNRCAYPESWNLIWRPHARVAPKCELSTRKMQRQNELSLIIYFGTFFLLSTWYRQVPFEYVKSNCCAHSMFFQSILAYLQVS